jgi:UDP-glucuronate 4-epimerase
MAKIILTGAAGFIGFHVSKALLERGDEVVGIDNMNEYYDVALKEARLSILEKHENFKFHKLDICDFNTLKTTICDAKIIIHLAAQAGVRYSLENPFAYIQSNIVGHLNILEVCRQISGFEKLIYASSSSVYGRNANIPFSVSDTVNKPSSLYAATKLSDELMTETYNHLYGLNAIGLRFFTVYGEYGRPDMAPFKFTKAILEGQAIEVYNNGDLKRDFTYIDDIVSGVLGALDNNIDGHKIYNLGNSDPVMLNDFISVIEKYTGKIANKNMLPMQMGDVYETYANIDESRADLGYSPKTSIDVGMKKTVDWYRQFYKVSN